jgi:hypothetical protein
VIDVKVVVKIGGVRDMFSRLAAVKVREVFKELRKPALIDQRQHDQAARGPDGRWPPLAASTLARRARMTKTKSGRKRKPNKLLGRLPKAMQSIVNTRSLIVRSRVKWSLAHQRGARVGNGAILPRRQFMWISDWLRRHAKEAFVRALVAAGRRSL